MPTWAHGVCIGKKQCIFKAIGSLLYAKSISAMHSISLFHNDVTLSKWRPLFGVLYYFRVLFPMELMFWIDYFKMNAGYIDMHRPGMVYRVLISTVLWKPAEIFLTTLSELYLLHSTYTWWFICDFSFLDFTSHRIQYSKILDYPK